MNMWIKSNGRLYRWQFLLIQSWCTICNISEFGFGCWYPTITIWMADEDLLSFLSRSVRPPAPKSALCVLLVINYRGCGQVLLPWIDKFSRKENCFSWGSTQNKIFKKWYSYRLTSDRTSDKVFGLLRTLKKLFIPIEKSFSFNFITY